MKKLLCTHLYSTKLTFGIKTIKMTNKEVNDYLGKFEKTVIKRSFKVTNSSKNPPLFYGLKITPIKLWIVRKKIHFLIQLMR